jgi:pyruvate-formate lyase-activating enzyme
MCDGSASSLIAKEMWENKDERWLVKNELDHLQPRGYNRGRLKQWYEQAGYTEKLQWWQDPKFYDKLKDNAEHIRTLKFTGGEPTLIPQVIEVIDYMLETRHSEHIKIVITTNGTYKGRDIYEKMCMFKEANVNLSVDGTGAVYNYIRYPHTWSRWTKNTKRMLDYKEKLNISYQFTTSVFNLFNIREMEDWIHNEGGYPHAQYHPNYVFNPKMMNIRYLPEDTLERAVDYLNGGKRIANAIIKFIWESPEISDEHKELYQSMLKSDILLKDRLRKKRPSWDTIDNDMLRLKDIMYG